jgi:UDP-glucose 4-epimerase
VRVLVTGGTGFIGSHTVVELIQAGHQPVIIDSLVNSKSTVLDGIEAITGVRTPFFEVDVRDREAVDEVVAETQPEAVMHFAALKAVGESVAHPLRYYDYNVTGTARLLEVLDRRGIRDFVFSSSATVYGDPESLPVTEESPIGRGTNPYGWTKIMMEQVLSDLHVADPRWVMIVLRYFNPVGAHPSGRIGEDPTGTPANLMPYLTQVAAGILPVLSIFGRDYPTRDGTGIRDFVHVVDVARGHVVALEKLAARPGQHVFNLGTGRGHTVLEVVTAFEAITGMRVPYEFAPRRPGDVAATWAAVDKAERDLGWKTEFGLEQMCADAWRWQRESAGR